MVVYASKASTWKVEAAGPREKGQPELYGETLAQKTRLKMNKKINNKFLKRQNNALHCNNETLSVKTDPDVRMGRENI